MPEEIPATYADTGERCVVSVRTLATGPPRRTFAVGARPVSLLSPYYCDDGAGSSERACRRVQRGLTVQDFDAFHAALDLDPQTTPPGAFSPPGTTTRGTA